MATFFKWLCCSTSDIQMNMDIKLVDNLYTYNVNEVRNI